MLERREAPMGLYVNGDSTIFVEIVCKTGVDYIIIETEHGPVSPLSYEPLATFCRITRLYGVTPFVRLPSDDPVYVGKVLDAGALGVIVPHLCTAESARRAVDASFFPPVGRRGCGPLAAANDYVDPYGQYLINGSSNVLVGGLIEDEEGVDNCEEIVAVEGFSFVKVGIVDLAASMGLGTDAPDGGASHPRVQAARRKVFDACKKQDVAIDLNNYPLEYLEEARTSKMRWMRGCGTDVGLFYNALKSRVGEMRKVWG
jgi:2-keto-3-deoxy-L-rhamnonate aldolase RhmA